MEMDARQRARAIKLMAFDVDGVLTDGTLYFTAQSDEMKGFSSLDGLGITQLFQGVADKQQVLRSLLTERTLAPRQAGYMGDDVVDLPVLSLCGFAATVADGHPFVKQHVHYIAQKGGGRGAVREVCDFLHAPPALQAARLAADVPHTP